MTVQGLSSRIYAATTCGRQKVHEWIEAERELMSATPQHADE
jgi:hypothetical protein